MAKLTNFRRYPRDGYIAGVCAGVAVYLDWNVKWIRLLSVLTLIFAGGFPILVVYGLLWYLMDTDDGPAPYARDGGHRHHSRFDSRFDRSAAREDDSHHYSSSGPTMDEVKQRYARMEDRLRGMEECVSSNDFELRRELRKLES